MKGYKRREHAKWLIFLPSVIHCESPERTTVFLVFRGSF